MARIINNGKMWVAKLVVGADESIYVQPITAKITIMVNNVGSKNKYGWLMKNMK